MTRRSTATAPAAIAALLALPAAAAGACEPPLRGAELQRIEGSRYVLAWRALPALRGHEFLTIEAGVCAREGQPRPTTLRMDATMPEHRHGINYRPSVTPRGTGRFEVAGVLLHMAGRWEFVFDVNIGPERETLRADVLVP